ncbi:diaminopimelate decarboxylase [Sphingomicrobium sp. XHP0239]|uniref:diaminopimelate decarboxylase n=1 Tax=Sphingomicrobium maritimum TaxID=3133972 RepID=UPI0031CC8224
MTDQSVRAFTPRDGVLHCEGVSLLTIAEAVGTPTYVYSAAMLRGAARSMQAALAGLDDPVIAYAMKANSNPAVLRLLAEEGLGADIVSIGEYRRARAAGIATDRIVFSGVGKTVAEMEEALAGGLLQFNVESVEELRDLSAVAARMNLTAPVGLRINPDVAAGTHAKITTGTADTKFGIPAADAMAAFREARTLPGIAAHGITIHIGSQLTSLDPLEQAFARLGELIVDLRADGSDIRLADLGGGLGVDYGPDQPNPPTLADYGALVEKATRAWNVRLAFEPGRLIAGEAGVLLARVVRIKPGAKAPWLILDAAMNDLMRPTLYDAYHLIEAVRPGGKRERYNVVGPVCESGDTFARRREMDHVEPGELVVFRTVGAYGAVMANGYNSRALTPEVMVDGDRWALVRERVDLAAVSDVKDPAWR